MTDKTLGIWLRNTNILYILETGTFSINAQLDRLRAMLISRDLLVYSQDRVGYGEEPYLFITVEEAKERNYPIETFFLNAHVEAQFKKQGIADDTSPWE